MKPAGLSPVTVPARWVGGAFIRDRGIVGIEQQGGVGNQLFQYATARALANRLETVLNLRLLRRAP